MKNIENELQALRNAIDSLNLKGYTVHETFLGNGKSTGKYYLRNDEGISITGTWGYTELNHFILGYGKAMKAFKEKYLGLREPAKQYIING